MKGLCKVMPQEYSFTSDLKEISLTLRRREFNTDDPQKSMSWLVTCQVSLVNGIC